MLGLPKGQVFIIPWTEQWIVAYEAESRIIRDTLQAFHVTVHHIGSTAIRGLSAKPIIDIAIEIDHFEDSSLCAAKLEELGYRYLGTNILPERHYLNKGEPRTHQIHMYEKDNRYLKDQLLFRNYLNVHEEARTAYQDLKMQLSEKYKSDKHAYADAKTAFVRDILAIARNKEER
ncbi:GrpB family protein [Paenibacillus guangzhouensis]|uniref:GrpB family protein n=1 Tax=Paenibacillus guangzhouensis TaxID=1473112 RepID=UPI001266BB84|nr:GrpB family protein [Paenibacillus guangzhouensis]